MSEERDLDDAYEDDLETPEPSDTDEDPGPEDDLSEEDLDEEDGQQPEPVEARSDQRQPTRGESRQQRLSSENARLRAELEEVRRGQQSDQQRQRADDFRRQEEERVANMSEGERIEYRVNQRLNQMQLDNWVTNDRTAFNDFCRDQPAAAAMRDEVEQIFNERVRSGQAVDRITIAKFLVGEKAFSKAPRARAAGRRASEAGRDRQSVRAPSSRSDAAPAGRGRMSEREARFKRIEDVKF